MTIHNHVYHLQHLVFDSAEMAGISRDLAYASLVLGSSNHVRFPLAWGTVLQSIQLIRCIALMSPVVGFETQIFCTGVAFCSVKSLFVFPHTLDSKRSSFSDVFFIVDLYIIHNILPCQG